MKKEQLKEMIKGLVQEILSEGNSQFRVGDVVIHDGSKCTVIEVDPKDGSLSIEDNKTGMSWDLVDPYDVKRITREGLFVHDQTPEQVKRANHADGYDAEEERRRMYYHRSENNPLQGVTFFNVPVGQEETAKQIGLSHFPKSKKWGMKHFKGRGINRAILVKAEQAFGKGRYWEPTR